MIGRTVSHYRIVSTLGSGGMGVVYLAEDDRLGRQVALKFLPATWANETRALERFHVEARAASALSHPAICAIYDIGQDGDTPFIVMEALKGETLRERIARGPLKIVDVLEVGTQLADALEAAHARGIVHRDIKPANIFIGDRNRVKVLDFGLAKVTGAPLSRSSTSDTMPAAGRLDSIQITQPGTAVGTVSYMSPEQARGEDIDSRTDLFSLGAVLYEMVTGSQAFAGNTTAVVYEAILNRAPRPIAHLNPVAPARLETVIATALEKDRDLRYQHASDLHAELRRIRRDLESGSLVTSQSVVAPARASQSSQAASPSPGRTLGRERLAIAAAVAMVVAAALFFWRQQGLDSSPVATPAVSGSSSATAALPESPAPATSQPDVRPPSAAAAPLPKSQASAPPARPIPVNVPAVGGAGETTAAPTASAPSVSAGSAPAAATITPQPPTTASAPASTTPPSRPAATSAVEEANAQAPRVAAPDAIAPPAAPAQPANVAARPAAPPQTPLPAPVETDDAAIRRVIRVFERAIETKDIALYRSVRPHLSRAAETVLMNSFSQIDSQEIDLRVENLRIDGRTASAQVVRRDTLVTRGRRQTQNSTQTLRFEKTEAGWIIAE